MPLLRRSSSNQSRAITARGENTSRGKPTIPRKRKIKTIAAVMTLMNSKPTTDIAIQGRDLRGSFIQGYLKAKDEEVMFLPLAELYRDLAQ